MSESTVAVVEVEEEYAYVGDVEGSSDPKIHWYQEIQAQLFKLWLDKKEGLHSMGSRAMLQCILPRLNELRESDGADPIETFPKSYTNKNAGSLLDGMRKRVRKRIDKKDGPTIQACLDAGVIRRKAKDSSES